MIKTALTFLASALAVTLVLAPVVEADVRQENGRFVFAPRTNNDDPVSILQIGGQSNDQVCRWQSGRLQGRIARTTRCFGSHLGTAWRGPRGATEMKERNAPKCNGGDSLRFAGVQDPVDNLRSLSTHARCKNQYHVRLWADYAVNSNGPGEFSVATAYYEERGTCSFCDGMTTGDHKVTKHWETVENLVMFQMRHQSRGEDRYCGQNDYRPVPGERTGRDKRGLFSNGRISRLSVQKPDYSKPEGDRCAGA